MKTITGITGKSKTMTKSRWVILGLVLSTLNTLPTAMGYEAYADFTGGHLKGTVTLEGPPVPPKRSNLVLNPDPYYCGRISDGKGWRLSRITSLGPHHTLKGAIVYLYDIKKGKPFSGIPRLLKLENCLFIPSIQVMQVGESLHIQNWDPVQHQVEIFLTSTKGGIRLFGADLPPHPDNRKSDYLSEGHSGTLRPGREQMFSVDQPGLLFFRCNYHEYMESWSMVMAHPYYAMTQESGEFSMTDIPPGAYMLMVWHPHGTAETPIRIQAHETLSLNVQLPPSRNTNDHEKPSKSDPFGIDLVGDQNIVPSVELQTWNPGPRGKP